MTPSATDSARSRAIWIGVVVVVVVLGIVAVIVASGGGGDDDSAATTVPRNADGTCKTTVEAEVLPDWEGQSPDEDPAACTPIPEVSGDDVMDGTTRTISPDDGKPKVVMFVAHWCPHCQREVPVLTQHLAEAGMPDDVELVAVSTGVQPSAGNYPPEEWLEREGWPVTTIADDDANTAAQKFGLTSYPYFVAVDDEGRVVARSSGELAPAAFDVLVEAARTGAPPS